jgi:hypothetical protein
MNKTLNLMASALIVAATTLSLSSCSSDEPFVPNEGTPIDKTIVQFTANTNEVAKRIAYGATSDAGTPKTTPIYWTTGDRIMIASPEHPNQNQRDATYIAIAQDGNTTLSGTPQTASFIPSGEKSALKWANSSAIQNFYAFYPANLYSSYSSVYYNSNSTDNYLELSVKCPKRRIRFVFFPLCVYLCVISKPMNSKNAFCVVLLT